MQTGGKTQTVECRPGVKCIPRVKWNIINKKPFTRIKQRVLCAFGHPVATCWVLLAQVWNGQFWATNTQHVATHRNTMAKRTHVALNNVAICCVGMFRSFGRGLRLWLGSGVDCVETNPDPLVTEFDVSWTISAPVTHREALWGKLSTLHCLSSHMHHKLISSVADMAQILHKGDSLYSLLSKCFFVNYLVINRNKFCLFHFIWNMNNAYINIKPTTKTDLFIDCGSWKNK